MIRGLICVTRGLITTTNGLKDTKRGLRPVIKPVHREVKCPPCKGERCTTNEGKASSSSYRFWEDRPATCRFCSRLPGVAVANDHHFTLGAFFFHRSCVHTLLLHFIIFSPDSTTFLTSLFCSPEARKKYFMHEDVWLLKQIQSSPVIKVIFITNVHLLWTVVTGPSNYALFQISVALFLRYSEQSRDCNVYVQ